MKYTDKEKINNAKEFINDIISYFEGMIVLTEDEQAILNNANNTIDILNN